MVWEDQCCLFLEVKVLIKPLEYLGKHLPKSIFNLNLFSSIIWLKIFDFLFNTELMQFSSLNPLTLKGPQYHNSFLCFDLNKESSECLWLLSASFFSLLCLISHSLHHFDGPCHLGKMNLGEKVLDWITCMIWFSIQALHTKTAFPTSGEIPALPRSGLLGILIAEKTQ